VRTQRLSELFVFGKRNFLCRTVDRRARCENKSLDSARSRAFEQMESPSDVRIIIKLRLLNGRPDAGARGEMKNRAEFFSSKHIRDLFAIPKIDIVHGD